MPLILPAVSTARGFVGMRGSALLVRVGARIFTSQGLLAGGGHHPMGDATCGPVRLSFNPQLRVEFPGATVTSDAGLLLPRELDEHLGLGALIERHLRDPRTGRNSKFPLPDLFRQSIYSRLARYEDTNDAERLAEDPAFRMLASRERRDTSVALTSTLHWFETDVFA